MPTPGPTTLAFGLSLHVDNGEARRQLDELCALLSEDTGFDVRAHAAHSPIALAAAISAGQVHVAWISPTLLLSDELADVVPLLSSVRQGAATFHAVLFVNAASSLRTPDDLRGSRVAWVARTSAAGYIVPRVALARRGLVVRTLFASETFCNSHGAVAWAVHERRADVGATYAVFEGADPSRRLIKSGFLDFVPELAARTIDVSGPIRSDMIVAHPSVPMGQRALLAGSLSRLAIDPVGRVLVRGVIGADEFLPFSHEAVLELRDLLREARGQGVDGSNDAT